MVEPISAILSVLGTMGQAQAKSGSARYAAKAQKQAAMAKLQQRAKEFRTRELLDRELRGAGELVGARGEEGLMKETGQALPELQAAQQAAAAQGTEGQQQASAQLRADLAKSGVRGGQAGQLMARQSGQMGINMQRQLDEMALREAEKRRQMRGDFFARKGTMGLQRQLSGAL